MSTDTTVLLDQTFPRSLEVWVQEFSQPAWRGATVQAWLFEGLAARRATGEDLEALAQLLAEAARLRGEGLARWNDFVRIDEKIHLAIARIAGNPLYDYVLHSVHDNIQRYYDKFLAPGEQEMEENFQDLRLIIEAIAAHQPEQASGLARAHIRRFSAYMKGKRRSTAAQSGKINRPNGIQ